MELEVITHKIEEHIKEAREEVTQTEWSKLTRKGFIYTIHNLAPLLEKLKSEYEKVEEQKKTEIKVEEHIKEIEKMITLLERNQEMEETRLGKMHQKGIESLSEKISSPELYADLEQQCLTLLLKSSYEVDRIKVKGRKRDPIMRTTAAQRNVLDLLDKQEQELSELRKKYEETRKQSYLGMVEKESSIEIENELNKVARKLEGKTELGKKLLEQVKETKEKLDKQISEMEERLNFIEGLEGQLSGKTFELITLLKKERDYSKRTLLEMQQETLNLRNTYSQELVNLQGEKISLKNSIESKYEQQIRELRSEIEHYKKNTEHLQKESERKDKAIERLEEQNEKLQLIKTAKEKHEKIKKEHKEKEKKIKKKKKKTKAK